MVLNPGSEGRIRLPGTLCVALCSFFDKTSNILCNRLCSAEKDVYIELR